MSLDNKTDATSSTERTPITYEARHRAVQEKLGGSYQEVAGKIHGAISIIRSKLSPAQAQLFEELLITSETGIQEITLLELILLESYAIKPTFTAAKGLENFICEHPILKKIRPDGAMSMYDHYKPILLIAWKEILSNIVGESSTFKEAAAEKILINFFRKANVVMGKKDGVEITAASTATKAIAADVTAAVTVTALSQGNSQSAPKAPTRAEELAAPEISPSATPSEDTKEGQEAASLAIKLSSKGNPVTKDKNTSSPPVAIQIAVEARDTRPENPSEINRPIRKRHTVRIVAGVTLVVSTILAIIASRKPSTPSTDPVDTPNLQALDAGQDAEIKNVPGEQPTRTIDLGQDDNDASIPSASPKEVAPDTKSSNFSVPSTGSRTVSHPIPPVEITAPAITPPVPTIPPTTHPTAEPISTSVPITPQAPKEERWF